MVLIRYLQLFYRFLKSDVKSATPVNCAELSVRTLCPLCNGTLLNEAAETPAQSRLVTPDSSRARLLLASLLISPIHDTVRLSTGPLRAKSNCLN